jgi:2-dehydro-3-deoxygluconokinase
MPAVVREACRVAKEMRVTVSCDLNYRSKLWSLERAGAVMADLMQYVDVLLCNAGQAKAVFGLERSEHADRGPNIKAYEEVARELAERFGLSCVAMTLRDSLSADVHRLSGMLYDGQRCYQGRTYQMQIVDRIGGGDAFGGGLIYGLLAGLEMQEVIEFAVAASCLKHSIPGDFNLVSRQEVRDLAKGDGSGRIRR